MDIGRNIRAVRLLKGLTMEELAESSGISRAALSEIETNHECNPRTKTLESISEILGIDVGIIHLSEREVKAIGKIAKKGVHEGMFKMDLSLNDRVKIYRKEVCRSDMASCVGLIFELTCPGYRAVGLEYGSNMG